MGKQMVSPFVQELSKLSVFAWLMRRPVWLRPPLWIGGLALLGPVCMVALLAAWLYVMVHGVRLLPTVLDGELK